MALLHLVPGAAHPLHDTVQSRAIETQALAGLPPHTLMRRAGAAVARLARALAPHARSIWIACGPGNNGGDGLEAAVQLKAAGLDPVVTWLGRPDHAPADSLWAHQRAQQAGVRFAEAPPADCALAIDAVLGLGARGVDPDSPVAKLLHTLSQQTLRLAVDCPSGLNIDTGQADALTPPAQHTLSLLTLKPGLWTADGRDACGDLWWDDLDVEPQVFQSPPPCASLIQPEPPTPWRHTWHKGSRGDVTVVGGAPGLSGAAILVASSAIHKGAGRVFLCFLGNQTPVRLDAHPALMTRTLAEAPTRTAVVVCGCGGGTAVADALPDLLRNSPRRVLDADALNAIAATPTLQTLLTQGAASGHASVLTPHPLEAARLLGCSTVDVQADRLRAAQRLADRFQAVVVLKGSGTVLAAPGQRIAINPTGHPRLATAGSGDVLAGWIAARWAQGQSAWQSACTAVFEHGLAGQRWPENLALTADALASCPLDYYQHDSALRIQCVG
ncbi:MAG: bifunctional ADP-dependent NAD(P)H-hydrate dehydratase/NAD(P)H-hydrate epimerase [Rhodoferax sp.]